MRNFWKATREKIYSDSVARNDVKIPSLSVATLSIQIRIMQHVSCKNPSIWQVMLQAFRAKCCARAKKKKMVLGRTTNISDATTCSISLDGARCFIS